jgi:hypothetical protein
MSLEGRKRDHLLGSAVLETGTGNSAEPIGGTGRRGPDFHVLGNFLRHRRGCGINDDAGDQRLAGLVEGEDELLRQRIIFRCPAALTDEDGPIDHICRRPGLAVILGHRALDLAP